MIEDPVESGLAGPTERRGALLREAREKAGLSVEDMAKRLRLSIRQIHALEADEESALPPATFIRGFVRNYARALDLDPALFLPPAAMPEISHEAAAQPAVTVPRPDREIRLESGRTTANRRWLVAALVALVLGAFGSWVRMEHVGAARELIQEEANSSLAQLGSFFGRGAVKPIAAALTTASGDGQPAGGATNSDATTSSAAPSRGSAPPARGTLNTADAGAGSERAELKLETAVSTEPVRDGQVGGVADAPASHVAGSRKLELAFDADSWVEVRDETGKVLLSGVSKAGEHRDLEAHGPVRIVVGNAPGTRVSWDGHPIDLAEFTRVTVARLTLDPAVDHP